MDHRRLKKYLRALFLTLVILLIIPFSRRNTEETVYVPIKLDHLECAIALKAQDDTSKVLIAGMCYDLLKKYSLDKGMQVDISLERRGEHYIDSLQQGTVDLIAIPKTKASQLNDVEASTVIDNLFVLVSLEENRTAVKNFDAWFEEYAQTKDYASLKRRFLLSGSPFKRAASDNPGKEVGPYDALIKKAAASINWDWRMMSALVWQESQFRIDVESRKGAAGLMQMMPNTAATMGCKNIIDPQECITTGTLYLARLQRLFSQYAKDQLELEKMTLAAYNAGEGRIRDCIQYAEKIGADHSTWASLIKVIPEMNAYEKSESDTVEFGKFKGLETIAYVDAVQDVYDAFCKICPN